MINAAAAARVIAEAHARGQEVVTVTITSGAAAGARYVSASPSDVDGTVDVGLDEQARGLAAQVWASRQPVFVAPLFAELHSLNEPLIIYGAGHIAVPLANIAQSLGFQVTVLDDREDFAQPARFEDGVEVRQLDFAEPVRGIAITSRSYVVLVTRAHKYDFDCLRAVLSQAGQPRYIGMIGSKRRVRAAFKALLDGGVPRSVLAAVHAPVGIEIGAETPAEIAVSIAAQLVQIRHGGSAESIASEARVLERMFPEAAAQ